MYETNVDRLFQDSIVLLQNLIATPSTSRDESKTADLILGFMVERKLSPSRRFNNVFATNRFFDQSKPSILIASHHDTVPPAIGYTRNPYSSDIEGDRLYGLGANDAGGCLVCFLAVFRYFYDRRDLAFNLIFAATAEEEISGDRGIASFYSDLPQVGLAIMGEPTSMDIATAEKGLIVVDCKSTGRAGHAAREEGVNAIYVAMQDIKWISEYRFPKISEMLGSVKMNVTVIDSKASGDKHNVVPDQCDFVVDVRSTDAYSNEEIITILRRHMKSEITPRSLRLRPSCIKSNHALVRISESFGSVAYGSATLSDQALLSGVQTFKMAPGESSRSHSPDEFVCLSEIKIGIEKYISIFSEYDKFLNVADNPPGN